MFSHPHYNETIIAYQGSWADADWTQVSIEETTLPALPQQDIGLLLPFVLIFIWISFGIFPHAYILYRMVFGGVNGWFMYNQVTPKRGILIANILIYSLGREKLTDY